MIWKILSATAAVFVLVIGYFVFIPADSAVLTSLITFGQSLPFWSLISPGVNRVASMAFEGFIVGIIIALIAVVLYIFAGSQAEENTSSEL